MESFVGIHAPVLDIPSSLDAIKYAHKLGATAVQIFVGDKIKTTLTGKEKLDKGKADKIKKFLKKYKMKIFIHSIMRLNYCYPFGSKRFYWGLDNLIYDMKFASKIGSIGCVVHMGVRNNKYENISENECIKNYIKSVGFILNKTPKNTKVILEVCANEKNKIGGTLERFGKLFNKFTITQRKRLGVCVDTQHIFAAGYPIHTLDGVVNYFIKFNNIIGLKYIKLIHLNDSCSEFGSTIDRHAGLGMGYIFNKKLGGNMDALKLIIHIASQLKIPIILETNVDKCRDGNYKREIKLIRKYMMSVPKNTIIKKHRGGNKDIKNKVINSFKQLADYYKVLSKKDDISKYKGFQYNRAIKNLKNYNGPIISSNNANKIPGIGNSMKKKIDEIAKSGNLKILKKINKDPKITAKKELQKVLGIGPEKADKMIKNNIMTIRQLKIRKRNSKIKLTKMQKMGLKYFNDLNKKITKKEVLYFKNYIEKILKKKYKNISIILAGSYRTGKEMMKDIDIILTYPSIKTEKDLEKSIIFDKIIELLIDETVILDYIGENTTNIITIMKLPNNVKKFLPHIARHVDLRLVPINTLHFYKLYFGSGVIFSRKIRSIAKKKGYKLTQHGLENLKSKKMINIKTEKGIFKYLNVDYIKPENR